MKIKPCLLDWHIFHQQFSTLVDQWTPLAIFKLGLFPSVLGWGWGRHTRLFLQLPGGSEQSWLWTATSGQGTGDLKPGGQCKCVFQVGPWPPLISAKVSVGNQIFIPVLQQFRVGGPLSLRSYMWKTEVVSFLSSVSLFHKYYIKLTKQYEAGSIIYVLQMSK